MWFNQCPFYHVTWAASTVLSLQKMCQVRCFGQHTWQPERVTMVPWVEVAVQSGEGIGKAGVVSTSDWIGEVDSRKAGFKWSIEITSCFPLISTVKCLSALLMTWYGPSYGCCRGFFTTSCRTKTWVQLDKAVHMCTAFPICQVDFQFCWLSSSSFYSFQGGGSVRALSSLSLSPSTGGVV